MQVLSHFLSCKQNYICRLTLSAYKASNASNASKPIKEEHTRSPKPTTKSITTADVTGLTFVRGVSCFAMPKRHVRLFPGAAHVEDEKVIASALVCPPQLSSKALWWNGRGVSGGGERGRRLDRHEILHAVEISSHGGQRIEPALRVLVVAVGLALACRSNFLRKSARER